MIKNVKIMKKSVIGLLLLCLFPFASYADEGMWLVSAFQDVIYPQMKQKGVKLQPGEIYNETSPALCSAIVAVNGGMGTGSVISKNGLVITNHHVAYGDIHNLSTSESNYLETGFWAQEGKDELSLEGTTITFLRKVVDVTEEATAIRTQLEKEGKMTAFGTRKIYGAIEKKYGKQSPYEVSCASMWRGQQYLLFYYETFKDVRLVGAPPVKIGAFGGEQDNWSWPQHKGDFALYRVYAGKDGKPAEYSKDNVPIKPVKVLNISTSGVHDDDYAMILGFPGSTNRYQSSFSVYEKEYVTNPIVIKARRDRLDIMKRHMEADPKVRLQYSDKYFGISNYADFARWENICLRRYDVIGIRQAEEQQLAKWIAATPERKAEHGELLEKMKVGYETRATALRNKTYYQEAWIRVSDVMMTANRLGTLVGRMQRENIATVQAGEENLKGVISNTKRMMRDFDLDTDKAMMTGLMQTFIDSIPRNLWGEQLCAMYDQHKGNIPQLVDYAFENTCCTSLEKLMEWFATPRTGEDILEDPMAALAYSVSPKYFSDGMKQACEVACCDADKVESEYAKAIYKMREEAGVPQYPDANSTMRLSYGTVGPISPSDGVHYDSRTTINGYTEKYNPKDYEFRVDEKMLSLVGKKDWGRWGEKGELYVNFLTNNDITGGNSGSPVLNAKGDVIGLAFDGNRESMSGDIYFHPTNFKTVCVDIRFVLWIVDKYAGAGKLIDEMKLVK